MERMTWTCRADGYDDVGLRDGVTIGEAICRLAAYENTGLAPYEVDELPNFWMEKVSELQEIGHIDHLRELAQAEKDGRLIVLPCKNDTVYTIEEDYFNCDKCRNGSRAHYIAKIGRVSCDMKNGENCPFYVKEQEVEGFEISFDATGQVVLSAPGEFGYEGLEQFSGIDGKVYYTREEAEAALKKREEADNEAVR